MKIQSIIIALVPLLLTGCEMAAVVDWGADCPANSEDGKLVYIANESCSADVPDCVITDSDGKEVSYNSRMNPEPIIIAKPKKTVPKAASHVNWKPAKRAASIRVQMRPAEPRKTPVMPSISAGRIVPFSV